MNSSINYWEKILKTPSPKYKELFIKENNFLIKNISKNAKVLEVGCGNGRNIETVSVNTKNIIGIDIDPEAVKISKEKFVSVPEIKIKEDNVFDLSFSDKEFDVVFTLITLVNWEDNKIKALKEMKRVLKDGGKIIISVYSEDATKNRILQYEDIGLDVKEINGNKIVLDVKNATISEQFSLLDIENMAKEVNMEINNIEKIEGLAYIFELNKK
ncbi:MAG: class I SAM-dependent methyltransferase [Patescibacteria group bacterium]